MAQKNNIKANKNGSVPTDDCTKDDFASVKPDISISVSGDTIDGFSISANVDSPFDVDSVVFSTDGDSIGSMSSEPYKVSYTVPTGKTGSINFKVEVTDKNGNSASDSKSVTL